MGCMTPSGQGLGAAARWTPLFFSASSTLSRGRALALVPHEGLLPCLAAPYPIGGVDVLEGSCPGTFSPFWGVAALPPIVVGDVVGRPGSGSALPRCPGVGWGLAGFV